MKSKRLLLRTVSIGMALALCCVVFPAPGLYAQELPQEEKGVGAAGEAAREVVEIRNKEDFLEFAQNCSIDTWSADKKVLLCADIDLSDTDFWAVPVFTGVFDGQGHTVSGFRCGGDGYVAGLFRYIGKGGVVRNLTLAGEVAATDEKECTGGLCGVNYGAIQNCHFQGTVSGRNIVGGLVGINESTGSIWKCTARGRATGYYSTGGIAGVNHGEITACTNRVCVNNDAEWVEEDDGMGVGLFLSITLDESEAELFSGVDTGGIAGQSDGLIAGCANYGKIGYEHTGYNIGGIAGRQSGLVSACQNYGEVYGRKDVGGIVGQMEPYIEVEEKESSLMREVNRLHDLIEKTLDDMEKGKNTVKGDLDDLAAYGEGAVDAGDVLAGQLADFVDDNISRAQAVTERMEYVMDMLPGVFDDIDTAELYFSGVNRELEIIADGMKDAGSFQGAYVETDYERVALLSTVGGKIISLQHYPQEGDAVYILAQPDQGYGLDDIRVTDAEGKGVELRKDEEGKYSFTMPRANVRVEAYFGYRGNGDATVSGGDSGQGPVVRLSSNLSGSAFCEIKDGKAFLTIAPDGAYVVNAVLAAAEGGGGIPVEKSGSSYVFRVEEGGSYRVDITFGKLDRQQVVDGVKTDMREAMDRYQESVERIRDIIKEIHEDSRVSEEQMERFLDELEEMSDALSGLLVSLDAAGKVVSRQTLDQIHGMGSSMERIAGELQNAQSFINAAARDTRSIVDYVNAQEDIRFSSLGQEFDINREKLHGQLKGISGSMRSLSDNALEYSDVLNRDLRAVNDQINVIFTMLADDLSEYKELRPEGLYEDAEVVDASGVTMGKTDNCTNKGIVKGDINVGGIAGAMSIDEEDPEDNAAGKVDYRIGGRYITSCVITNCVNEGYVTAKKDGAGGVVGYMKLGIVMDSEGYGSVESTEGDYVGGICGESLTEIRRCYALCGVSGGKNVGGVAGYADILKDCYAMVDCNASIGRKGAIAGRTADYEGVLPEDGRKVSGNYYVGDGLGGIDDISYAGVAEPISYGELLAVENLPSPFRHLKVVFRVGDLYLGTQEVKFGEKLSCLDYPEIPFKEGCYGVWPDYSEKIMTGNLVVTGEYKDEVTVVKSVGPGAGETQEGAGRPYALVERAFTEDTVLHAVISHREPPEQAVDRENVVYDVTLEHADIQDEDTFAVRLYNPYEDAVVWGYRDGRWEELESKARGRYLQVEMTGAEQSFCIVKKQSRTWLALAGAGGAAAVTALSAALVQRARKARRGKKRKSGERDGQ